MVDIVQTKKLIGVVCKLANAGGSILQDGKVGINDLSYVWSLLMDADIQAIATLDMAVVAKELGELSEAELEVLRAFVVARLDLPQDNVEATIEQALALGLKLYSAITAVLAFIKQMKPAAV